MLLDPSKKTIAHQSTLGVNVQTLNQDSNYSGHLAVRWPCGHKYQEVQILFCGLCILKEIETSDRSGHGLCFLSTAHISVIPIQDWASFILLLLPFKKKATRLPQVQSSEKNQRNPWTCRYSKILQKACDAMNAAAYCATLTRVRDHTNPLGMFSLSHRRLTEQEQREREEKTGSREVAEQYIVSVRCPINSSV